MPWREATFKSLALAFALFIAIFAAAIVMVLIAAVVRLPAWVAGTMVLLVSLSYPIALNWTDMKLALRRKRGLCPTCAYDRRGLTPDAKCPECGTAPAAPTN